MKLKTLIALAVAAAFATPLTYATGGGAKPEASSGAPSASTGSAATGASASGAAAMFKDLDKNADGFISRDEAKGSPHEEKFISLDKDGDGKLSESEHAAAHAGAATGGTAAPSTGASPAPSTGASPAPSTGGTTAPSTSTPSSGPTEGKKY